MALERLGDFFPLEAPTVFIVCAGVFDHPTIADFWTIFHPRSSDVFAELSKCCHDLGKFSTVVFKQIFDVLNCFLCGELAKCLVVTLITAIYLLDGKGEGGKLPILLRSFFE